MHTNEWPATCISSCGPMLVRKILLTFEPCPYRLKMACWTLNYYICIHDEKKNGGRSWRMELDQSYPVSVIRKPILFSKLISRGPVRWMVQQVKALSTNPDDPLWSLEPHDGRREPIPTSCLMTSTCVMWHIHILTHINTIPHTHTHATNNHINNK